MDIVRRIYLYVMSAVALAVLAYGLQALLTVLLHALGLRGGEVVLGDPFADRRDLSLAIALVGVGLPVWAIHWYLIERGLRGVHGGDERQSALRALYLSAVLGVLIVVGGVVAANLLRVLIARVALGGNAYGGDIAGQIAILTVTAAGWGLHAWTRRRDVAAAELHGAAAWWPRLYRYVVTFAGLLILVEGVASLGRLLLDYVAGVDDALFTPDSTSPYAYRLIETLPGIVVALAAWASHTWASERIVAGSRWLSASERASRIRLGYWPLVVGVAAGLAITSAASGLAAVFRAMVGETSVFADGLGGTGLPHTIATAAIGTLPWLVVWWVHRRWALGAAASTGDAGRFELVDRLERHVTSGVGLAYAAVAVGWILGLLLDVVLGGNRTLGDGWKVELSNFVAFAVLGLPLWIWNWSRLLARRAAQPEREAGSAVRRSYLLLAVGVAIISTIGSLALVLYRLAGYLLGAGIGGNAVSELSTPVGALVVAAIVVVYHGLQLRLDRDLRPEAVAVAGVEVAAATAAAPEPLASAAERDRVHTALLLTLPFDADVSSTLAALRAALPEGGSLDEG